MNERRAGLAIMSITLSIALVYFYSLITWIKDFLIRQASWWSWWVIALPPVIIVSLTLLFSGWIGWVMFSASKKRRENLLGKKHD